MSLDQLHSSLFWLSSIQFKLEERRRQPSSNRCGLDDD